MWALVIDGGWGEVRVGSGRTRPIPRSLALGGGRADGSALGRGSGIVRMSWAGYWSH